MPGTHYGVEDVIGFPNPRLVMDVGTTFFRRNLLEYHALGGQPFQVPSTEKFTIEKVKPLHGTITLFGHHKIIKRN